MRAGGCALYLRRLFTGACAVFRAAPQLCTRDQNPAEWGGTQDSLGYALHLQARLAQGEPRCHLLEKSIAASQSALTTQPESDPNRAETQVRLDALKDLNPRRR